MRDGLLRFNGERRSWVWDARGIDARQITDNVVTLMAGRITALPESTQELLRFAACIGGQFELRTLAVIARATGEPGRILETLGPALRQGIVHSKDDSSASAGRSGAVGSPRKFRFQHDRVQQAAYSLIPESDRAMMHLQIARLLLGGASAGADLDASLFEIVSHFKKGWSRIETRDEALQVAAT